LSKFFKQRGKNPQLNESFLRIGWNRKNKKYWNSNKNVWLSERIVCQKELRVSFLPRLLFFGSRNSSASCLAIYRELADDRSYTGTI
jgi:hypothetical protein